MKRWPTKLLGEVAQVTAGDPAPQRAEDFSNDGIPFVRMQDVGRLGQTTCLAKTKDQLSASASPKFKRFPAGSILVPKSGASIRLNHRAILGIEAHVVSHLAVIVPQASLNTRFAYYWLCGIDLSGAAHDADLPSMKTSELAKLQIPVPPLAEQERIVKLLDEADELRKLRAQADRRAADLIPALFHEMFGGSKFKHVLVGELTSLVTSGSTPRGGEEVYVNEGPYFIRSQNVQMNRLDLSGAACLPADVHEQMARTKVALGDVLLNITGASIGRVAWVESLDREANVSQHVCLIRPKPNLLIAAYLSVFISLPTTQRFILQIQAGASRQALNHQQVRALEIPLPPLPLQKQFAQRVSEIRALQAAQAASRERTEHLFQSMLHRAFNQAL